MLNPHIDPESVNEKTIILDILAEHEDGRRTNLEMQTTPPTSLGQMDAWALFLRAETEQERRQAAMTYPELQDAIHKLETLGADPQIRRIVRDREVALGLYLNDIANAQEMGERRGELRGEKKRILSLCKVLKISLGTQRQEHLAHASLEELTRIAEYIEEHGHWPS